MSLHLLLLCSLTHRLRGPLMIHLTYLSPFVSQIIEPNLSFNSHLYQRDTLVRARVLELFTTTVFRPDTPRSKI